LADLRESVKGWLLERKLSNRNGWDGPRTFLASLVIRVVASTECLVSMMLITWVGALLGAIAAGGWHALQIADEASILTAVQQADRFAPDLLPVLVVWAVLLLLTPIGYDRAFSAMVVLAGIAGYLHLVPSAFLFPSWLSRASRALTVGTTWLFHLDQRDPKNPIAFELLGAVLIVALLLHMIARRRFRRLGDLGVRRAPRLRTGVFSRPLTKRLIAIPLIALLLMLVIWGGTVVRLAASKGVTPVHLVTYDAQAGLLERIPPWGGQLATFGREHATGSLWIALFACVPVILYGTHLLGRLLTSRTIKLN
jgi:hypothetical protein